MVHPCQFGRKSYEDTPLRKFRAEQDWACPAVLEARLDKPTVAPVNSIWTDH